MVQLTYPLAVPTSISPDATQRDIEELGFEEGVGEDGGGEEGPGGCEFAPKGTQEFGEHGL